jgi:hypothetical protein
MYNPCLGNPIQMVIAQREIGTAQCCPVRGFHDNSSKSDTNENHETLSVPSSSIAGVDGRLGHRTVNRCVF